MESQPSFYMPSGHNIELWRLSTALDQDDSSLSESLTPSQRRSSNVSFSSGPGLSPASSIMRNSRPVTPCHQPVAVDGGALCAAQNPITPDRANSFHLQSSPCGCWAFSGAPHIPSNVIQVHPSENRYFGYDTPRLFKNDVSTPVRSRTSFVSDTSSFPSPASAHGYAEDIFEQVSWNPVALPGGDEYRTELSQENNSITSSIDAPTWNSGLPHDEYTTTVNPSDTIAMDCSFSFCGYPDADINRSYEVNSSSTLSSDVLIPPVQECVGHEAPSSPETARGKTKSSEGKRRGSKGTKGSSRRYTRSTARARAQKRLSCDETTYVSRKLGGTIEVTDRRRSENPAKKVGCAECEAKFGRTEHLRRHNRKHTGEREYICAIACKGGDQWHIPTRPAQNCSRSDNQKDHYVTHLKAGGRNKCADKMFLYWLIREYEPERASRLIKQLEDTLIRKNITPGPPDERQYKHPDWERFQSWRNNNGTLEELRGDRTLRVSRSKSHMERCEARSML